MKTPIAEVEYNKMDFVFVSNHYDVHINGICMFNNELCEFKTDMETVYDYFEDEKPKHPDIICHILPLSFGEKLKWRWKKFLFETCVGKHWTYPYRKRGEGFYYRKPQWFYKWLFKMYYKSKKFSLKKRV